MAGSNGPLPPHVQSIDNLFGSIGSRPPAKGPELPNLVVSSSASLAQESEPINAIPADWPELPPGLESSSDARAGLDWLQGERKKLEDFTRVQFSIIHKNHQTLLAARFQHEQAVAVQAQQFSRDRHILASQAESLKQRLAALTQREEAVATREAAHAKVERELRDLEQARDELHVEVATRRTALEDMEARLARAEQGLAEAALTEAQRDLEAKQTELAARQRQMEQRYEALERAEAAAARRSAELDELECRLGKEFEKQERQLALKRREIETLRIRLEA